LNRLLRETVEDYEIVIVDDGSKDNTNGIIQGLRKEIPQIKLIRNERNMNVSYSFQRALKSATKEFIFWQTIDWSYDITYLRIFLELLKNFDIVVGVRRKPVEAADKIWKPILGITQIFGMKHLTKRSDTLLKALISVINYLLIRSLFQVPLSDFQNVTFCPRELLQSIRYETNSSFSNPEGLIKAYWKGASIVEVPISFLPRSKGDAKGVSMRTIRVSVNDIFTSWFRWMALGNRQYGGNKRITRLNPDEWEIDFDRTSVTKFEK
jgi:glycosyltransferase involved in cell wall biosynthesis